MKIIPARAFFLAACCALSSLAWAGAEDFPMGSTPPDVDARFPPFKCRTFSLGGARSACKYFEPPATHQQFNAPDLNVVWDIPAFATEFIFIDGKLEEIDWTFDVLQKVVDPAKLRAALELRLGKPSETHESSMGRNGGISVLDTTWMVKGERWMLRTYPGSGSNVDLHRFSKDARKQP